MRTSLGELSEKLISVPLCDLCASVVSVFRVISPQRHGDFHRGTEKRSFRQTPEQATARGSRSRYAVALSRANTYDRQFHRLFLS